MQFELIHVWQLLLMLLGAFALGFGSGAGKGPIVAVGAVLLAVVIAAGTRFAKRP